MSNEYPRYDTYDMCDMYGATPRDVMQSIVYILHGGKGCSGLHLFKFFFFFLHDLQVCWASLLVLMRYFTQRRIVENDTW